MTELNGIVLSRLPVLPLRGLTAFPNMIVHFDVGRMMSIRALEAAMKNGQTIFLTAQRELKTDTPTPSDLYQIGTICQIRQILRLPGDNIRVLVEGKTRALAHNFIAAEKDEDCMYAEVEELEDYVYGVTERRAQALVRTAQERFSDRSRGRRSGLSGRLYRPEYSGRCGSQAGNPRRAWHYPPPGDGDPHAR